MMHMLRHGMVLTERSAGVLRLVTLAHIQSSIQKMQDWDSFATLHRNPAHMCEHAEAPTGPGQRTQGW